MYFISTLGKGGIRLVGYFETFDKAEEIIVNNQDDIYECGYYEYAIIQNIPSGLYKYDLQPVWYQWNDINGYTKIDTIPQQYKNQCGFGIG